MDAFIDSKRLVFDASAPLCGIYPALEGSLVQAEVPGDLSHGPAGAHYKLYGLCLVFRSVLLPL